MFLIGTLAQRVPVHWLFIKGVTRGFLSGLHLEEALELEGHHLPVIARSHWEGHPVTGGLGQHAGRWRLAELGPCVARATLGGQERAEVRHRALPVLVVVGGKADRSVFLCRHGLPRLWRPVVGCALVTPAVAVMVKAPCRSSRCGGCSTVLVAVALLSPAQLVVFLGQRALGVGNWNGITLSTSHNASGVRVTYEWKATTSALFREKYSKCVVFFVDKPFKLIMEECKTQSIRWKNMRSGLRAERPDCKGRQPIPHPCTARGGKQLLTSLLWPSEQSRSPSSVSRLRPGPRSSK